MLRDFSMVMIILTHATAYFLKNKIAYILWDLSEFSVTVFIFCSFYLFFKKPVGDTSSYLKKRLSRLYIPYLIFLAFFLPLRILSDTHPMTHWEVLRHLTLTTAGNDLSWLVLLFIQLTFVGIVLKNVEGKKFLLGFFFFLSLLSAIIFLAPPSLGEVGNFKLIMCLPWSLVIFFTWFFVRWENKPKFLLKITLLSGFVFFTMHFLNINFVHRLAFYDNKYPPNLYLLSYGIFWICLLLILVRVRMFDAPIVKPLLNYLSRYSYSVYFIHFFILYYLSLLQRPLLNRLDWWGLFGVLLFGSIGVQWGVVKLRSQLQH